MKCGLEILRTNQIIAILVETTKDFFELFSSLIFVVESHDHEANELVKVHFSIAFVVDLRDQLIEALGCGRLAETLHDFYNIIIVDSSIASRVESIKNLFVLIDLLAR